MGVLIPLLLVLAVVGLSSAADYGVAGTEAFTLSPGEKASRPLEVSRCQRDGCTDTLRLSVTGVPGLQVSVDPVEIRVQEARAGQSFTTTLTVEAPPGAAAGDYSGAVRVVSSTGDTWRYDLSVAVRAAAAAPPALATPAAAAAPVETPSAAPEGGLPVAFIALGAVAALGVLLLFLRMRRSHARGESGETGGEGPDRRGPMGPLGPLLARIGGLLPRGGAGLGQRLKHARWGRGGEGRMRGADDSEVDREWERFIREQIPAGAPETQPPEAAAEGFPEPEAEPPPMATAGNGEAEAPVGLAYGDDRFELLRRDVEDLRAGVASLADLRTMVERAMEDLQSLREGMKRGPVPPAPSTSPAAAPATAEMEQRLRADLEAQVGASVEKLGEWLREAVKAITLMKAQGAQAAGAPGGAGLQPLFDGIWKEIGQVRAAMQRMEAETRSALQSAIEAQQSRVAALGQTVERLGQKLDEALSRPPAAAPHVPDVALQADLEALRAILRDQGRQLEGLEARLKNQELTFARGDEVRNLFRDVSGLKEDLGQIRVQLEEMAHRPVVEVPAARGVSAPAAVEPVARSDPRETEAIRREVEATEAFLRSLEEYRKSGLMPERLYAEKRAQSEEKLRELRRRGGDRAL